MFGGTDEQAVASFKKAARHAWRMLEQLRTGNQRIRDMTYQKAMKSMSKDYPNESNKKLRLRLKSIANWWLEPFCSGFQAQPGHDHEAFIEELDTLEAQWVKASLDPRFIQHLTRVADQTLNSVAEFLDQINSKLSPSRLCRDH